MGRVSACKAHWLSLSGRILLVKSILSSIPINYMLVLKVPDRTLHKIERSVQDFIWENNLLEDKNVPLVFLNEMATSKEVGVVGLHDLTKRNRAFGGLLIWKIDFKPNNKWC